MPEKKDRFGKEYFDSGKRETGRFANYSYDRMLPSYEKLAEILVKTSSPTRVLDIGCAKGFLVHAFRKLGVECQGIDISEYAISMAPEEIKQYLKVHDIDSKDLPFADDTFDSITAVGVLDYVEDRFHAIKEIKRVLKNGSTLFLSVAFQSPNDSYRTTLQSKQQWIQEFKEWGFEFQQDNSERNYLVLVNNFLNSSTSVKAAMCKRILKIPGAKNMLKPYIESRWGILFFRLSKSV